MPARLALWLSWLAVAVLASAWELERIEVGRLEREVAELRAAADGLVEMVEAKRCIATH